MENKDIEELEAKFQIEIDKLKAENYAVNKLVHTLFNSLIDNGIISEKQFVLAYNEFRIGLDKDKLYRELKHDPKPKAPKPKKNDLYLRLTNKD